MDFTEDDLDLLNQAIFSNCFGVLIKPGQNASLSPSQSGQVINADLSIYRKVRQMPKGEVMAVLQTFKEKLKLDIKMAQLRISDGKAKADANYAELQAKLDSLG